MESGYSEFVLNDCLARLDEILKSAEANYKESETVPTRDSLSFTNGFYVSCSALFIDMRNSRTLASKYKKPTLAKIYRAYISELVAILRGNTNVKEISIEGDCVWGIFDTPYKNDIEAVFSTGARSASLIDILNYKLSKVGIASLTAGIGMSYGDALMIKAGYKNSGVNEVAWMGNVVSEAAKLCSYGNRSGSDQMVMVSSVFYQNLKQESQKLLMYNQLRNCYNGWVVNTQMANWLKGQRQNFS